MKGYYRRAMKKIFLALSVPVVILVFMVNNNGTVFRDMSVRSSWNPVGWRQLSTYGKNSLLNTTNTQRIQDVRRICKMTPSMTSWRLRGYLHRSAPLFYCKIPKVASTFMSGFLPRIFLSNRIEDTFTDIGKLKSLEDESLVRARINDSFSYVIVREPYGRLFSAYENKLFLPNDFWIKLGREIIQTVRKPPTSLRTGHDVTFTEMLRYVILKHNKGDEINEHLEQMHERCNPCAVNFDFIVKIETMGPDLDSLTDIWKRAGLVDESLFQNSALELEAKVRSSQLLGPVHKVFELSHWFPRLDKKDLFLRTWSSYHIRGVILKQYSLPFNDVSGVNKSQYIDALMTAIEQSKDSKVELKTQREEALLQAYRTVPLEVLRDLQEVVSRDCLLFGYDKKPDKLFLRNSELKTDFNYFKGVKI